MKYCTIYVLHDTESFGILFRFRVSFDHLPAAQFHIGARQNRRVYKLVLDEYPWNDEIKS